MRILSSQTSEFKGLLAEASEKARNYDWTGAAQLYSNVLTSRNLDPNSRQYLELSETLAYCYHKAAFQANSHEEFKRIMTRSRDAYDNAVIASQKTEDDIMFRRMRAREIFTEYWLADDGTDMQNHLRECRAMSAQNLTLAKTNHDDKNFLYALKDELSYLVGLPPIFEQWPLPREHFDRAESNAEAAIQGFEASNQNIDLLESLYMAIILFVWTATTAEERKERQKNVASMAERIDKVAKEVGTAYAKTLRNYAIGIVEFNAKGNPIQGLESLEEVLQASRATRDTLLIGTLYSCIPMMAAWADPEDVEQRRAILEKGIRHASEAVNNLKISARPQWLNFAYSWWAESYVSLARFAETDIEAKKAQVAKALEIAAKGAKYDTPELAGCSCSHTLSKCLYLMATWTQEASEKKRLLAEAVPLRVEMLKRAQRNAPGYFDVAVMHNYLALIRGELSNLEEKPDKKIGLLQSAISEMRESLEVGSKWGFEPGFHINLARYHEQYADYLVQIYHLTRNKDEAMQGIKSYEAATDYLRKAGHLSTAAGLWWKIGNAYDLIGEHDRSASAFKTASRNYEEASRKHVASAATFSELASYMHAWTSIQEARLHHREARYSDAAENYVNAATILNLTKRWKHLGAHYQACASLEKGEMQSQEENHAESIRSFESALQTFQQTGEEIRKKLNEDVSLDDKSELENWVRIATGREEYCQARIDLEEAFILDMSGDEEASARKFRSASAVFRKLREKSEVEQSKRELEELEYTCDAWAKMKLAEAKALPELYSQAAESFNKARDSTSNNKYRLVALASASLCHALEMGTRFRQTRDPQLYSEIKKSLETAGDYYRRGGLVKAAEWVRATQRLFDALTYLTQAETEIDSKKKTELYHLSEKHLQLAAKLYENAGYPSKRDEALTHLERAREEKQLLLTPMEALADSPAIAGVSVAPVSLIRDKAVGLEKFDAAHVVGNMGPPEHECSVGSDLTLELELANVGKTPATLIKLENIATPGLDINRQTSPNRYEDNYVDLRGKRLDYMKSHEVKVSLKARHKGTFELRPRILFVDEQGNYKSYQFEPTTVTVRELGISGWVKGPK